MDTTYSERVKQSVDGLLLLQQATTRLAEVVGPSSASSVKAAWDRPEDDKGRPLFSLRISDWTGSVSAMFTPTELKSPEHLRVRLYRLWGELLQARVEKKLQKLNEDMD